MDPLDLTSKPDATASPTEDSSSAPPTQLARAPETKDERKYRQKRTLDVTRPSVAYDKRRKSGRGGGNIPYAETAARAAVESRLALPFSGRGEVINEAGETTINEVSEQEAEATDPNSFRKKVYLQGLRLINAIQLSRQHDLETKVKHSITAMSMMSNKEVIVWDARSKAGRMEVEEVRQISDNLSTWLKRVPSKDKTEAVVAEALVAIGAIGEDNKSN